jgi:hypothetical protein
MPAVVEDLVSIQRAAALRRLSRSTIRELLAEGLIHEQGTGARGARFVSLAELDVALERRRSAFEKLDDRHAPRSSSGRRVRGPDKQPRRHRCKNESCGKLFRPERKRDDRPDDYCSLECYRTRNGPRIEPRVCALERCPVVFTPRNRGDAGLFCSREHEREARLEAGATVIVACFACGNRFDRAGSHARRNARQARRHFCAVCFPVWDAALGEARLAAERASTDLGALRAALAIGQRADEQLRELRPPTFGGRRRDVARAIAVEALFVGRRMKDVAIRLLWRSAVSEVRPDYVKRLRRESLIRRPEHRAA